MAKDVQLKLSAGQDCRHDLLRNQMDAVRNIPEAVKTGSAGAAAFPENGTNREGLFALLDSYLYKAEAMGEEHSLPLLLSSILKRG